MSLRSTRGSFPSRASLFGSKPVARTSDPDTSHAAARSVTNLTEKQDAVLNLLRETGSATDWALSSRYFFRAGLVEQSESGLRTRRSELVRKGLVHDTGERETLPSGRKAIIWAAV